MVHKKLPHEHLYMVHRELSHKHLYTVHKNFHMNVYIRCIKNFHMNIYIRCIKNCHMNIYIWCTKKNFQMNINIWGIKKLPHKTLCVHSARYRQCIGLHVSSLKLKLPKDIHTNKVQTAPTHPIPPESAAMLFFIFLCLITMVS